MGLDIGDPEPAPDECAIVDCSERARQREIAAYLSAASFPPGVPTGPQEVPRINTDATLNALVQLGALRLDCSRAFMSLIDREYQFICAEATRTQSLTKAKSAPGDSVYLGLCKLDLCWGVCPTTMKAFTDDTGKWIMNGPNIIANKTRYIINDFRKDPGLMNKPFVTGPPYMVSYLEVPLISPLGYILGSYCVVDNKLRDFDNEEALEVMNDISSTIMSHLELVRLKQCRARSEELIRGLGEFIEHDSPIPHDIRNMSLSESTRATSEAPTSEALEILVDKIEAPEILDLLPDVEPEHRPEPHMLPSTSTVTTMASSNVFSPDEQDRDDTPISTPPQMTERNPFELDGVESSQPSVNGEHTETEQNAPERVAPAKYQESTVSAEVRNTFARAAAMIRGTMNMDGLLFLDAVPNGFGSRSTHNTPHEREDPFVSDTADSNNESEVKIYCETMAQSVGSAKECPNHRAAPPRGQLPEAVLQRFIRRFPRGHIFSADAFGPIDCSYGPGASLKTSKRYRRRSSRVRNDVIDLFSYLPEARYIIFLPLWHFQRECWFAATLGWVTDIAQAIEVADINLLTAFGNSVMAEVSRYEALAISRAKSDFISSISHELRSPLHGILASGELLREAITDSSLISMLDMIDSCGTTLLDTFNNLLDYAKINNVAKGSDKLDNGSARSARQKRRSEATLTDLSQLVQDVVETVNLGHTSKTAFQASPQREGIFSTLAELAHAEEDVPDHSVLVTLNIEKRASWVTKLDVGAWKRIVMNIFGNALKYTRSGHIEVGLKINQVPDGKGASRSHICFSVRDTGIGMSSEYLKYQLFTPFAQENSLSPGTGLGLSIVQQIVKRLHGKLDVQSSIGIGTFIKVLVPFNQDTAGSLSLQLAPITEGTQLDAGHRLRSASLCCITPEAYKSLVNPGLEFTSEVRDRAHAVKAALKNIAEGLLGMKLIFATRDSPSPEADIYFFDAYILGKAVHGKLNDLMHNRLLRLSPLIVLCSGAGPLHHLKKENLKGKMLHLRHPIGPKKLANVFLEALKVGKTENIEPMNEGMLNPPTTTFDITATPKANGNLPVRMKPPNGVNGTNGTNGTNESTAHSISFPHRPEPTPVQHSTPSMPLTPTAPSPAQRNLLLVDDNPINLRILTTLVKKLNHTFVTASNGLEAVQLFQGFSRQNHNFDYVFMDISMPIMNGFEATREIRKFEKETGMEGCQIVALTGLGSEMSRQEAFTSGTNLFLTKPVKLGEIKKLLNEKPLVEL